MCQCFSDILSVEFLVNLLGLVIISSIIHTDCNFKIIIPTNIIYINRPLFIKSGCVFLGVTFCVAPLCVLWSDCELCALHSCLLLFKCAYVKGGSIYYYCPLTLHVCSKKGESTKEKINNCFEYFHIIQFIKLFQLIVLHSIIDLAVIAIGKWLKLFFYVS